MVRKRPARSGWWIARGPSEASADGANDVISSTCGPLALARDVLALSHMRRTPVPSPPSLRAIEHERAFRRWSMPAPAEVDPEAEGPASFRVYTPAELRHAPLRMSRVAFERHSAPPPASSPALLTWLGAGVALGVLLLTLGVVALTVGEGGGYAGVRLRTMMAAEPTPEVAPVAVAMVPAIKSLDLPDEAPPPKPRPKAKKARIVLPANPF